MSFLFSLDKDGKKEERREGEVEGGRYGCLAKGFQWGKVTHPARGLAWGVIKELLMAAVLIWCGNVCIIPYFPML